MKMKKTKATTPYENKYNVLLAVCDILLATDWSADNCKSPRWFKQNTKLICEYFGNDCKVSDITSQKITEYVTYLKTVKQSANGTVNRKLSALSKIVKRAYELGIIDSIPIIHKLKENSGRIRYLTDDEEKAVLDYFESHNKHLTALTCIVLIDTGIRCGEFRRLTTDDIFFSHGQAIIILHDTKNNEDRAVPLTERAHKALNELAQHSRDKRHFTTSKKDSEFWLKHDWNTMKHALGYQNDSQFVPHCLRHTCASRLVQRGAPIYSVSKWLGHKTLSITQRYAHLRIDDLISITSLLEK